jgi:hypothetical protein
MPFEPTKPPHDADEFASPQIELLADQLRHDAQWLAAKYPAHKPRLPLARPRRLHWVAVASVAVLLLLAVDAWRMWHYPPQTSLPKTFVPPPVTVVEQPADALAPLIPAVTNPRPLGYSDLGPAEKEALLDLLEQQPTANVKVSF